MHKPNKPYFAKAISLLTDLLIYCPQPARRIHYVLDFLQELAGETNIRITVNPAEYRNSEAHAKINYSIEKDVPGIRVYRSGFLDETGINPDFALPVAEGPDGPVLFPGPGGSDVFAAIFWCLSRYEEYQPFTPDRYGRFPAPASALQRLGLLHDPVCDRLGGALLREAGITTGTGAKVAPTVDIDMAYYYLGKGLLRGTGSLLKQLLTHPGAIADRLKILAGTKPDPTDCYHQLAGDLAGHPNARIFWHCGMEHNDLDKQVRLEDKRFRELVCRLSASVRPGIHPSAYSASDALKINREKQWLEQAAVQPVDESRQHFILLKFPETYRALQQAGIRRDYSMGYPDATGFRAGTCRPFRWYDLEKEEVTDLEIQPFCIMDVTCRLYEGMTPEQAMEAGQQLKETTGRYGGDFCFIFHNESLGSLPAWRGWNNVFESWMASG